MELSVAAMRASFAQIGKMGAVRYRAASESLAPLVTAGVPCREVDEGPLVGHWLEPAEADDLVIVYLHGGGFIFGSIRTHGNLAGHFAKAAKAKVFLPAYPLAPEHPLPAAVDHVVTVVEALITAGHAPDRIVLAGDSAGGNLVFTVLCALRDRGGPKVAAGFAISPWVDLSNSGDSFELFAEVDYCVMEACREAASCALGDQDPRAPSHSPLFADLRGLPPVLIHAGGAECLRDQIVALGERASSQGVDIELHVEPDMVHVWHLLADTIPQANHSLKQASEWIRDNT